MKKTGGSWTTSKEKEQIKKTAARLISKDPHISAQKISQVVKRDPNTVRSILRDDKKFMLFLEDSKKKLIQQKLKSLELGNAQITKALEDGKMDPYRIIGMDSRFWDQVYGSTEQQATNNTQVNVSVTRGDVDSPEQTYSNTGTTTEPDEHRTR